MQWISTTKFDLLFVILKLLLLVMHPIMDVQSMDSLPHPHPFANFLLLLTPLAQISFSPQPSAVTIIKDSAIIFAKKTLCTCLPKLCLLIRLLFLMRNGS